MSPRFHRKPAVGQQSTLKNHVTYICSELEPAIWSHEKCDRRSEGNSTNLVPRAFNNNNNVTVNTSKALFTFTYDQRRFTISKK